MRDLLAKHGLAIVIATIAVALSCSTAETTTAGVAVHQLAAGDASCPNGGVAITANGTTAYACNGAAGAQGAQGGGLYTSRDDVYCDTVSGMDVKPSPGLSAECRQITDLPLSGSCNPGDATVEVFTNKPMAWTTQGQAVASWQCAFAVNGTPVTDHRPVSATICCVHHP
jgi:hypothetical protein